MSKYIGKGATISMTVGTTVSAASQILGITPPQNSSREAESTTLDSTFEEHLFALVVPGTAGLRLGFDPADTAQADWLAKFYAGTSGTFNITLGSSVTYGAGKRFLSFTGYLTAFAMDEITIDEMNKATVGIRVNSVMTASTIAA